MRTRHGSTHHRRNSCYPRDLRQCQHAQEGELQILRIGAYAANVIAMRAQPRGLRSSLTACPGRPQQLIKRIKMT